MRLVSQVQIAGCLAAVLLAGCGGTGSENAATEGHSEGTHQEAVKTTPEAVDHGTHAHGALLCPVSDHEIGTETAVVVNYEGREVQLCCEDCVEPFNKEPARYIAKLDAAHEGHSH